MDLNTLSSILPSISKEYLSEFLRCHPNPQEGIEGLFELQDKLIPLGSDNCKLLKCIIPNCQINPCLFFHNFRDRRRSLTEHKYRPSACFSVYINGAWDYSKKCQRGDHCEYCHNPIELQFHPENRGQNHVENRRPYAERSANNYRSRKINDLKNEIHEIDEILTEKRNKLNEVQEQILSLTKFANCAKCERNLIEYALPCGHLFCEKCKALMNSSCSICSIKFDLMSAVRLAP